MLALAGDRGDNIPGIPGIGPKIASELVQKYGSLDNVYKNLHSVSQVKRKKSLVQYEQLARLSKKLVTLNTNIGKEEMSRKFEGVKDFQLKGFDREMLVKYYGKYHLNFLREKLLEI